MKNNIKAFAHCRQCMDELPKNKTPREFIKVEVGFTDTGHLQIWCIRHEKNVYVTPHSILNHNEIKKCGCGFCEEDFNGR